jgi:heme/copper-type cytochrome/quinol oxidase subunit 4
MENSKIHIYNLIVLFSYMILLTFLSKDMVLITSIIPIAIQIFVNIIFFFANFGSNRSLAYTYLLSAFLVLIIGFPSCWGFSSIGNKIK